MRKARMLVFLAAVGVILVPGGLWALDNYLIEAPVAAVLGPDGVTLTVVPRDGLSVDSTPHEIEFANLPAGVSVSPADPLSGWRVQGPTVFRVSFESGVRPGPLGPVVMKSGDPSVKGSTVLLLESPPARFVVTPLPPRVGDPAARIQVAALDDRGMLVTAFQGDVELSSPAGPLEDSRIDGNRFAGGIAEKALRFQGPAPAGSVRVTARSGAVRGEGRILMRRSGAKR